MIETHLRWTRDPSGSGHPVPVVRGDDGCWRTEDGRIVPESLALATPAEVIHGKARRRRRLRMTGMTHASRTAPMD
jgi:hypothetical protein